MKIYPAIDIIGGKCVRLTKGDYGKIKEYSADPCEIAREFKNVGAEMLHVIDLEGAKEGQLKNFDTVSELMKVGLPIQNGGGIRDFESAKKLLDAGVSCLILGTAALYDRKLVEKIVECYGTSRVVISLDYRGDSIAVKGWQEASDVSIGNFLQIIKEIGIKTLIITDIERDGMLKGINVDNIARFLGKGFEIIVAGGVSSIEDLKILRELGVDGAIIGKALYDGKIDLKQAIKC